MEATSINATIAALEETINTKAKLALNKRCVGNDLQAKKKILMDKIESLKTIAALEKIANKLHEDCEQESDSDSFDSFLESADSSTSTTGLLISQEKEVIIEKIQQKIEIENPVKEQSTKSSAEISTHPSSSDSATYSMDAISSDSETDYDEPSENLSTIFALKTDYKSDDSLSLTNDSELMDIESSDVDGKTTEQPPDTQKNAIICHQWASAFMAPINQTFTWNTICNMFQWNGIADLSAAENAEMGNDVDVSRYIYGMQDFTNYIHHSPLLYVMTCPNQNYCCPPDFFFNACGQTTCNTQDECCATLSNCYKICKPYLPPFVPDCTPRLSVRGNKFRSPPPKPPKKKCPKCVVTCRKEGDELCVKETKCSCEEKSIQQKPSSQDMAQQCSCVRMKPQDAKSIGCSCIDPDGTKPCVCSETRHKPKKPKPAVSKKLVGSKESLKQQPKVTRSQESTKKKKCGPTHKATKSSSSAKSLDKEVSETISKPKSKSQSKGFCRTPPASPVQSKTNNTTYPTIEATDYSVSSTSSVSNNSDDVMEITTDDIAEMCECIHLNKICSCTSPISSATIDCRSTCEACSTDYMQCCPPHLQRKSLSRHSDVCKCCCKCVSSSIGSSNRSAASPASSAKTCVCCTCPSLENNTTEYSQTDPVRIKTSHNKRSQITTKIKTRNIYATAKEQRSKNNYSQVDKNQDLANNAGRLSKTKQVDKETSCLCGDTCPCVEKAKRQEEGIQTCGTDACCGCNSTDLICSVCCAQKSKMNNSTNANIEKDKMNNSINSSIEKEKKNNTSINSSIEKEKKNNFSINSSIEKEKRNSSAINSSIEKDKMNNSINSSIDRGSKNASTNSSAVQSLEQQTEGRMVTRNKGIATKPVHVVRQRKNNSLNNINETSSEKMDVGYRRDCMMPNQLSPPCWTLLKRIGCCSVNTNMCQCHALQLPRRCFCGPGIYSVPTQTCCNDQCCTIPSIVLGRNPAAVSRFTNPHACMSCKGFK